MLMLLHLVLELAAGDGTADHAEETVAEVVAASEASSSTANSAHQTTLTLLLVVWVGGAELTFLALRSLAVAAILLAAGECQCKFVGGSRTRDTDYCCPWPWD